MVNGCAEDMQTTLRDTQEANLLAEAAVGALRESEATRSHDFDGVCVFGFRVLDSFTGCNLSVCASLYVCT